MEPAVLALVGLTLTVMIHLDRSRGRTMQKGFDTLTGALNQLRTEMNDNDDKLRAEMTANDDKLRAEMQAGFAANATALNQLRTETTGALNQLRTETTGALNQIRTEMTENDDKLRAEMQAGFAANATALLELARNVGRVEGRTETLVTSQ